MVYGELVEGNIEFRAPTVENVYAEYQRRVLNIQIKIYIVKVGVEQYLFRYVNDFD